LLLCAFFIDLTCSDYAYREGHVLQFRVLSDSGEQIANATIDIKAGITVENTDYLVIGSFDVQEEQSGYHANFRYRRLWAPIQDILGPLKTWPNKLVFTIEKEGFQKQTKEYSRSELTEKYLQEKRKNTDGEQTFIVALPNIRLEVAPRDWLEERH